MMYGFAIDWKRGGTDRGVVAAKSMETAISIVSAATDMEDVESIFLSSHVETLISEQYEGLAFLSTETSR